MGEDDDYDNNIDDDDGDVSMTTVNPTQSQPSQPTQRDKEGDDATRGVKRSLDEDEEYD